MLRSSIHIGPIESQISPMRRRETQAKAGLARTSHSKLQAITTIVDIADPGDAMRILRIEFVGRFPFPRVDAEKFAVLHWEFTVICAALQPPHHIKPSFLRSPQGRRSFSHFVSSTIVVLNSSENRSSRIQIFVESGFLRTGGGSGFETTDSVPNAARWPSARTNREVSKIRYRVFRDAVRCIVNSFTSRPTCR